MPVQGSGASTRVYALETTPGYDAAPGPVTATGRNLDVAMKGNAWLAVQALDGTEAYTRGGALDVDADGTLVTRSGLPVLGDGGPITVPANREVSIARDGTVSAKVANGRRSVRRQAQARHARGAAARAATTACSAPPTATCRPTPRRACRTARSKAATSARSRPWSR